MTKNRSLFSFLLAHTFVLLTLLSFSARADHVIFVIHGTWASTAQWATAEGDFFKALEHCAQENKNKLESELETALEKIHHKKTHVVPFTWSGKKNHAQRQQAAKNLVKIMQSYPQDTQFTLVAHSHGVNVSLLASEYLGQEPADKQRAISTLYALGGPIKETRYAPNMDIIKHVYNLFSFGDIVQPVFNKWQRVFNPHERIANLAVTIEGQEPKHSELHSPLVGASLPLLDQKLRAAYADTLFVQPGSLHFSAETPDPIYKAETYEARTRRLEEDQVHVKRRWFAFLTGKAIDAVMGAPHAHPSSGADSHNADPAQKAQERLLEQGLDHAALVLQAPGNPQAAQESARWLPAFINRFGWAKAGSQNGSSKSENSSEHESKEEAL